MVKKKSMEMKGKWKRNKGIMAMYKFGYVSDALTCRVKVFHLAGERTCFDP
jgi:hypothetical protein